MWFRRLAVRSAREPSGSGTEIGRLLDGAGSDKGRWYGQLYDLLLEPMRDSVRCLIEVGIGTMIPTAPSSMVDWSGKNYRPGGSLRVWRDYLPLAEIHGIDPAPDTTILDEPRISTHRFDSRDAAAAEAFLAKLQRQPDVVIDDGLHTREAQIATIENFLPHVRPGGLYIVEDVELADAKAVCAAIDRIRPGSIYVADTRPEPWVAIPIRVPH
jgi:hypothetical protein